MFMAAAMCFTMIPKNTYADEAQSETQTYSFAVLTDVHFISEPGAEDLANVQARGVTEGRLTAEAQRLFDKAFSDALATEPDAVLFCGDLTSNGEKVNAQALASRLAQTDVPIYLTNGNHDINNSYAATYDNGAVNIAERMTAADFKGIFGDYGYNKAYSTYGELSYAVKIAEGITLIVMDSNIYTGDMNALYRDAQMTAGIISPGVLGWAKTEAEAAKENGDLVLAMCHHGVIPHFCVPGELIDLYQSEYLVPNWQEVSETLADAGVSAVFTGHAHANDISSYTSARGNKIYDISTGTTTAYPMAWRTISVTVTKEGNTKKYALSLDTRYVNQIDGYDDVQSFAYAKTGVNSGMIEPILSFYTRELLYKVKSYNSAQYGTGLRGMIRESLNLANGSIGEQLKALMDNAITEQLPAFLPFETSFSLGSMGQMMGITEPVTLKVASVDISANPYKAAVSLNYKVNDEGQDIVVAESCDLLIDVSKLPSIIDQTIELVQNELDKGDLSNYGENDLVNEIASFVANVVKEGIAYEILPGVTLENAMNDAYQAHAAGSETADAAKYQQRLAVSDAIKSDDFAAFAIGKLMNALASADDPTLYPVTATVLETPLSDGMSLVDSENSNREALPAFSETSSNILANMSFLESVLLPLLKQNSPAQYITIADNLQSMAGLVKPQDIAVPLDMLSQLYLTLVSDTNEPDDLKLSFEYVFTEREAADTGDSSPLIPLVIAVAASAMGMAIVSLRKRER